MVSYDGRVGWAQYSDSHGRRSRCTQLVCTFLKNGLGLDSFDRLSLAALVDDLADVELLEDPMPGAASPRRSSPVITEVSWILPG